MAGKTIGGIQKLMSNAGADKAVKRLGASSAKSINAISGGSAASAGKKVAQKVSNADTKAKKASVSTAMHTNNNNDIWNEPWRYNRNGSRKTFDELSTPEVLTWISTLPEDQRGSAAAQFESEYLKNPASTRYDPYYTNYSNNDAARQMFGVDTFDQTWIDANRGYASYLTFTNESYTTPKKPGKNATAQEKAAYEWWQIANTYEATTQAAESEYGELRGEIAETIKTMRAAGQPISTQVVMDGIDWSDYKTLQNLREASAAGNGRMLNRAVRVGDESIKSMINAAIRGEDVTKDRDWVMDESERMRSREVSVSEAALARWMGAEPKATRENRYSDVTSADYDPYYGEGSNNRAAREMFGADVFDQEWIDANRGMMAYIKFKDEDDQTPIKPGDDASDEEKKAYQYWLIANTYEETTREGEKELKALGEWMQRRAEYLGDGATAEEIVSKIDWDEYPTLQNMREVAAVGNARMVNREVHAGDASIMEMARAITGEDKGDGSLMASEQRAQIDALDELIATLPEGSEERADVEQERNGLLGQLQGVSSEAAAAGNRLRGIWQGVTFASNAKPAETVTQEFMERISDLPNNPFRTNGDDWEEKTAAENKAKAQAALASQQAQAERIEAGREDAREDYAQRVLEGFRETEVDAPEYNEYVGSMRAQYGLSATLRWVSGQIARLEISAENGTSNEKTEQLYAEYVQQRELLKDEQDQRALIEERFLEDYKQSFRTGFGPITAGLWYSNFNDAKADGDGVPLDQYEEYLQYRMIPGTQWGDEVIKVNNELAQYDERNTAAERAGLLISGVEEGSKSANTALGMKAAENITYWLKSREAQYQGLTREEIYAIDYDLQNFRAWNGAFEGSMDAETKQALSEEYPVFGMVSMGISEVMKMSNQSAAGGVIGQGLKKLTGLKGLEKVGGYLPFGLDAYNGMFEQAISEGATPDQAMLAGVINGAVTGTLSSGMVDIMKGVGGKVAGRLFSSPTAQKAAQRGMIGAAKSGWGQTILSLLGTAVGEGVEEALEEPIQNAWSTIIYDRDRKLVGEGGLFDPKAMLQSGLAGAVAGGLYPVTSGIEATISARNQSRRQAQTDAQTEQQIAAAAQHVFELTSCMSGELGEAAQAKADDIITRIASGEAIDEREYEELREIAARNASIEDAAEEIVRQNGAEIEAAQEAAAKAEETAQSAAQSAQEAQAEYQTTLDESRPLIRGINEGTTSYGDEDAAKRLSEAYKAAKAAQGTAAKAAQAAQDAEAAAQSARQAATDTEERIRAEARTEAQTQVESEMAQEKDEDAAARAEAKKQKGIRPKGKAKPGVREMYTKEIDRHGRNQLRILDALGKEYGIEFDLVDAIEGGANAAYDPKNPKVIRVAINASESAYVQAGVHEMVHYVKKQSGNGYVILEQAVLNALKKNGVDDAMLDFMISERMEQYKQLAGQELTRDEALEEIIAEAVPTVLTDEDAIAELVKENRTLVEKLRDFFIEFSNKLREIAERYMDRNNRIEMGSSINDAESLREIAYALDEALSEADGRETAEKVRLSAGGTAEVNEAEASEGEGARKKTRKKGEKDLAARLVRKYGSDIPVGEVRAAITEVEDAYSNMGDKDAAEDAAARIARKIAEASRNAVSEEDSEAAAQREMLREQYKDTREMLRESGISLTDVQKQEVASAWGSYNAWRRSMMGNVLVKNEAKSLDAVWQELSEMHPEMFPADTNEAQMPEVLGRFIEQVRPGRKIVDGMDAGSMAAAISLEIQSEVLSAINREAEAVNAQMAAEAIRDKARQRAALKQEARREARTTVMREIAGEIRAARDARDDAALQKALEKYREKMGKALKEKPAAIITLGMDIRSKEQDINRVKRQIELLKDARADKDVVEGDREESDVNERIQILEEMLKNEERSLREMHRQQMIERSRSRLRGMDEETDPMSEMAEEIAREDLKDSISRASQENQRQIRAFTEQMRAKQKDYSQISTLNTEDIDSFFGEMLSELQQNSALARDYEEKVSDWRYQLESEEMLMRDLKRDQMLAQQAGDEQELARISSEISGSRDRSDVLKSRIRYGQEDAKRFRRMGAQSIAQALREGRLSQPIMERVIAMCADAQRKNNWFNKLAAVKNSNEAIRLNWTTAARVWDDLFGDAAPIMRAIYYDPIMDNETERQRWIKAWRERISALKLSKEESRQVQMIGEGVATLEEQTAASEKVLNAIEVFKEFYNEAYQMADKALTRNGYPHLGRIEKYFPHITKPDTILETLGISDNSLPTSINGLTEMFSPGRQYSGHTGRREGYTTDFDALYGFEEYIGAMSNVIYHTDDIQRHRQLESEIRTAAANGIFDGGKGSTHLSEFVKWLHEYTNQLAGKKASSDRWAESEVGRNIYRAANALKNIKGASAVCGNLSSAITNFIPVQQVRSEHPIAFLKAAAQLSFSSLARSNMAKSSYITRRFGSDTANPTWYTRFTKGAGLFFNGADILATNLVVNTYYQANLDMGMDSETAMRSADAKAARLMGDRSKGAMPNVYGSQVMSLFTQFQYEVANQSQHFRKDIWRGNSLKRAFGILFNTMLTGFLWNTATEWLIGRRTAADPIDIMLEAYSAWSDNGSPLAVVQSMYNNISDLFPYLGNGRIAAFESIVGLFEAAITNGNDGQDLMDALTDFAYGILPMGGQLKKSVRAGWALARGGVYNRSGTKLNYALDGSDWATRLHALMLGTSATFEGQRYYSGEAPGLSESKTANYEQARERGYSSTEAYANEAAKAKAEKLDEKADKAEKAAEDEAARERSDKTVETRTDASKAESQREEARALRGEAMPGELLSDYWYGKRDTAQVKAGIELWRQTGETWALPTKYDAETKFEIDYPEKDIKNRPEYLDEELANEVTKLYAEGYMEIMHGVNISRMDEDELEKLRKQLEKLKSETDDWAKARLKEMRE